MRMQRTRKEALKGGGVAGLVAGAVLAVVLAVLTALHRQDVWLAMKGAAAPFFRGRAMVPGFDAPVVLTGVVAHFVVSIIWGVLFAFVAFGFTRRSTVWLGLLWGIIVWIGMAYFVLPIVGLAEMARMTPIGQAIGLHLVFGLVVAVVFLPYQVPQVRELRPTA